MDKTGPIGQNGIQNKNAKHKLDELYIIWLGKGDLFQQNDPSESYDATAIENLLADVSQSEGQEKC